MILPVDTKIITGKVPSGNKKISIDFSNQPPTNIGRQGSKDVIKNKPGVAAYARNAVSPLDTFKLFFTDEILDTLVMYTNKKIESTFSMLDDTVLESDKYPHVKLTNEIEFEALLGLLYFRGLYNLNNHSLKEVLFSNRDGLPVFGASMSRQRFEFLMGHLCFDDFETRETRWIHDRFAAMRELFEHCNKQFAKCLVPEDCVLLDEILYP